MKNEVNVTIGEIATDLEQLIDQGKFKSSFLRPLITALKNYYIHSSNGNHEWRNLPYSEADFNERLTALKTWAVNRAIGPNTPNVYKSRAKRAIKIYQDSQAELEKATSQEFQQRLATVNSMLSSLSLYSYGTILEKIKSKDFSHTTGVLYVDTNGSGVSAILFSRDSAIEDLKKIQETINSILNIAEGANG